MIRTGVRLSEIKRVASHHLKAISDGDMMIYTELLVKITIFRSDSFFTVT